MFNSSRSVSLDREHEDRRHPIIVQQAVQDNQSSGQEELQVQIGVDEKRKWMETLNGVRTSTNGKKHDTTLNDIELGTSVSFDKLPSDDIILTTSQLMNKTDFGSELKPMSDTSRYMKELVVLLNVQPCTLDEVVDKLLDEVSFFN